MSTPSQPVPEKKPEEKKPEKRGPPNHIYIGKKPLMTYATSAMIQLAQTGEVVLKARGMAIARAVDVAEIITRRLGVDVYAVRDIKIGTERVGEGEQQRNVSTIEITVGKR